MFALYFGAFDVVLYALAFMTAIMVSGGICDAMESAAACAPLSSINSLALSDAFCLSSPALTTSRSIECSTAQCPIAGSVIRSQEAPRKPVIQLSDIKLYKLHQRSVVFLSALPLSLPDSIKRYRLRGEPVVRLETLKEIATVIA